MNLRGRLRKQKIKCSPWKKYKGEISNLPISAQCLFSKNGLEWDILEIELRNEGWLFENEELWAVLSDPNGLKRQLNYTEETPFEDSWTDEDYKHFYNNL